MAGSANTQNLPVILGPAIGIQKVILSEIQFGQNPLTVFGAEQGVRGIRLRAVNGTELLKRIDDLTPARDGSQFKRFVQIWKPVLSHAPPQAADAFVNRSTSLEATPSMSATAGASGRKPYNGVLRLRLCQTKSSYRICPIL